jgi:hypothetical protein
LYDALVQFHLILVGKNTFFVTEQVNYLAYQLNIGITSIRNKVFFTLWRTEVNPIFN